jgi:D-amino-acid dehydrogenase
MKHRPLVIWPSLDMRLYGWLARMLANCTENTYRQNKGRMVRLAEYSRDKPITSSKAGGLIGNRQRRF